MECTCEFSLAEEDIISLRSTYKKRRHRQIYIGCFKEKRKVRITCQIWEAILYYLMKSLLNVVKKIEELSGWRMMDPFEVYYLFTSLTISIILSSIHRRGTSDTGLKVSFGTVIRSALQTIPHLHGASVFLLSRNGARWKGSKEIARRRQV